MFGRQEALSAKRLVNAVTGIRAVDHHRIVMLRLKAGEGNVPVGESGTVREHTELLGPYGGGGSGRSQPGIIRQHGHTYISFKAGLPEVNDGVIHGCVVQAAYTGKAAIPAPPSIFYAREPFRT